MTCGRRPTYNDSLKEATLIRWTPKNKTKQAIVERIPERGGPNEKNISDSSQTGLYGHGYLGSHADNYIWSVIGARYPAEFNLATLGIMMGGHARVGFEDNIFIGKGVLAESNAELVEKVVRIARELGGEIAKPDEARKILGLKGRSQVNY